MKLSNGILDITIAEHGAELKSVTKNGREYMWQADPKYWGRTSPVLFPFVGASPNGQYKLDGKSYPMGQHGFARDCDFDIVGQGDDYVVFELKSNADTLKVYPYNFTLRIKYTLKGNAVVVGWTVTNDNESDMAFSIGAHPAFNFCDGENYFRFDTDKDITYYLVAEDGSCDTKTEHKLKNTGYIPIYEDSFKNDAYIIENKQVTAVSLCDRDRNEYVKVTFDAPLVGLWNPATEGVPFVCIEPWYGRVHQQGFDGDLFDREYVNILKPHAEFNAEYTMEFK